MGWKIGKNCEHMVILLEENRETTVESLGKLLELKIPKIKSKFTTKSLEYDEDVLFVVQLFPIFGLRCPVLGRGKLNLYLGLEFFIQVFSKIAPSFLSKR